MSQLRGTLDIILDFHEGKEKCGEPKPLSRDRPAQAWPSGHSSPEPGTHTLPTGPRHPFVRTWVSLLVRRSWISQGKVVGGSAQERKE